MEKITKFLGVIVEALNAFFKNLKEDELEWFIKFQSRLIDEMRDLLEFWIKPYRQLPDQLKWWQQAYREGGIEIELEGLYIPYKPKSECWPMLIAPATYRQIIKILLGKYGEKGVWLEEEDLDAIINLLEEPRRSDKPYLIWMKATPEATDFVGESADFIAGKAGATARECLLADFFYFHVINPGHHLSERGKTICSSRCKGDGRIVAMDFYGLGKDKARDDSTSYLRIRLLNPEWNDKSWGGREVFTE